MAFISSTPCAVRQTQSIRSSLPQKACNPLCSLRGDRRSVNVSLNRRRLLQGLFGSALLISQSNTSTTMAASEVEIIEVEQGNGSSPIVGHNVFMHYTLTLGGFQDQGGKVVDSSRQRNSYFSYAYGTGKVIKGWDQGVATMKVGGKRRIIVPPELGYGANGVPPVIPGNSTLYFDIELVRVD